MSYLSTATGHCKVTVWKPATLRFPSRTRSVLLFSGFLHSEVSIVWLCSNGRLERSCVCFAPQAWRIVDGPKTVPVVVQVPIKRQAAKQGPSSWGPKKLLANTILVFFHWPRQSGHLRFCYGLRLTGVKQIVEESTPPAWNLRSERWIYTNNFCLQNTQCLNPLPTLQEI